jgi:acetylornithine deacetylase/succinyl-diaminopimelate desuccinylase-like protein
MDKVIEYLEANHDRFFDEYKTFLSFESISADPDKKANVAACADWLADHLRAIGIKTVEVHTTKGHPIVYAEHPGPSGAPTVLGYGHYDVQPVDPLDLWDTPPFEANVRDGAIYARGSADDKGQLFLYVKAVEAFLKVKGELPVNVKFVFEGEEEIGSENLSEFLVANKEKLACDVVTVSDTSMFDRGRPSITYGLRGLTFMQVELEAADSDLHSGSFGGSVANPANELARIIASMKNDDQQITIDGFYDDVLDLTAEERKMFADLGHDEADFLKKLGAPALSGEKGWTTLERLSARPTLDVNGIWSGFTGEGAKTVLPSKAAAKISMRLVPNQDAAKISKAFEAHVRKVAPDSVRVNIEEMHGGGAFLCPLDNPKLKAAARALKKAYNIEPVFTREGGSIPIVAEFDKVLGAPILLLGYSVPKDNAHAPNEFFLVENFHKGINSSAYLLDELSK